jgi:hypothetical protein
MGKAIARAHYKIIKGIIRMEFKLGLTPTEAEEGFFMLVNVEIYTDKMTGYLLSGQRKTASAIVM